MMLRTTLAVTAVAGLLFSLPASAAQAVAVRVRIIKGSRESQGSFDPRLSDLKGQLERLSYNRWEEVGQENRDMSLAKPVEFKLPDGSILSLTLEQARGETLTFLVQVPTRKTHSRLTISRNQRIVHQVTDEKDAAAYFVTVRPLP